VGNPQNQNDPFALARKYREAGWLGTLPLPKAKKETPPTGFTGHGRPYPTDKQIEDWYQPGAEQNIALRLAEVPGYVPKGMAPREYELMAIDVDDYGDKNGAEQLANLEAKLGALPATVTASSRFDTAPNSGHRVFIVPAGHRFLGKAAPAIDIVQKSHRYLVVWPSVNPDAPRPGPLAGLAVYRWRDPNGAYYDERDDGAAIPALDDVAVLPDAWFDYLTCGGQIAVDVPISELTLSELNQWAKDTWNDPMGDMCRLTEQQLERQIEKMKSRPDSHPNLTEAHAELCYLAMEGHTGVIGAINQYSTKWLKMAAEKRDGIPPMSEINRSYLGMLSKLEPQWRVNGEYMPDDPCDCKVDAPESVETWLNLEDIDPEVAKAIAEMDYGGLGPIVGKLLAQAGLECEAKEPGDYDQNDHGNAQHFIDLYGTNIKYVNARKDWVLWDGERWHRDLDATLAGLAFDVVKRRQMVYAQSLPIDSKEAIQVKRSWRNWALKSGNASQIAGCS
jgi:hypothetical protein